MPRWIVRFGYDGSEFSGWARQPGCRTIEGTIRDGLGKRGVAPTPHAAQLEVASRTDRGVSARANVLALSSELSGSALLRRLNTVSPAMFFTAISPAPAEFRVRRASRRVYRFFDPTPAQRPETWVRAAERLRGRVDVRSLGRGLPSHSPVWRTIERVTVDPFGEGRRVEVVAASFVWGMVRKIVGALREIDAGRLSLPRLEAALAGQERLTLPMAEPDGLVLWDVAYPKIVWQAPGARPSRYQERFVRRLRAAYWQRGAVVQALFGDGAS